jgi:protein-disulfide isomerase
VTKKQLLVLTALFLIIAVAFGAWMHSANEMIVPGISAGFEISPKDHTMGNPKAKVVLIEYGALTCPFCARFNNDILPQVKKNYIDSGKVFYVYRLYQRLPEDGAAQKLALCPKDSYFNAADLLYRNQDKWDPENGIIDVHGGLVRIGRMMGLSPERIDACIDNSEADQRDSEVKAEAESRYHLEALPFFLMNGVAQDWKGDYEDFAKLLDHAAGP